ncbi:MAG: hypothetical protein AAF696_08335, partial [Bacteroidota bacterium]
MGLYALTSGPAQPEFSSFEPAGTSEMVDLSTGDFNYNINLLDVSGFPINLSYHGGYGMDTEAGMVGLGWNLNIGQLNRSMRGLPDEFEGDVVKKTNFVKPNDTYGLNASAGMELAGIDLTKISQRLGTPQLSAGLGVFYNNYRGLGFEFTTDVSLSASKKNSHGKSANLNLSTSFNSQNGLTIAPSIGISAVKEESETLSHGVSAVNVVSKRSNISAGLNSRTGLTSLSLSTSIDKGDYLRHEPTGTSTEMIKTSQNGGASISFSTPSYTPSITMPFSTVGLRASVKVGGEFLSAFPNMTLSGYFSRQFLSKKVRELPAYGFLNQSKVEEQGDESVLMDYNRYMDGKYLPGLTPNLPVPQATYDVYSAMGHGIAGSYRPHHSGVYAYADPVVENSPVDAANVSIGGEPGGGNAFRLGANLSATLTNSSAKMWRNGNKLHDAISSPPNATEQHAYEPYYFKNLGEKSVESDPSFYQNIGNEKAVYVPIKKKSHRAENNFKDERGNLYSASNYHRTVRAKRNQHLSFLTGEEMQKVGKLYVNNFKLLNSSNSSAEDFRRIRGGVYHGTDHRKDHHPAEFKAINPDGSTYIFGLPAYNLKEVQKTFALPKNLKAPGNSCSDLEMIVYPVDNSSLNGPNIGNSDKYFEAVETPAYAHTYLLTDVHSPDYVDLTGNGISTDDPGNAYKINYGDLKDPQNDETQTYKWRVPLAKKEYVSNLNKGIKTNKNDDKGSYVYGEREQWYVSSIESKDRIAIFFYSDREDGIGVKDEHGGLDMSIRLKKLDRIELYSRDQLEGSNTPENAIKTIHFRYDYELCPKVPNNALDHSPTQNAGKLTLKELWFTYGDSKRGRLNPYQFTYSSGDKNPAYDIKSYDRWGNYSPVDCNSPLKPWDFPYVNQAALPNNHTDYDGSYPTEDPKRFADVYANSWLLTSIKTPAGAKIEIEYEADDYAYVQDKWANQMIQVLGAGPTQNKAEMSSTLYEKDVSILAGFDNHNYLFVQLPTKILDKSDFKKQYLRGFEEELYFNFAIDATADSEVDAYERIGGFVQIEDYGRVSDYEAWIKIEERGKRNRDQGGKVPHIAKIAWNHIRLFMSEYIYPGASPRESDPKFFETLIGFGVEMASFLTGPYTMMQARG